MSFLVGLRTYQHPGTVTVNDHVSLITIFKPRTISMTVYRVLVGKPEGKRPHGRSRRRWEENIKIDLQEAGCGVYGLDRAGSG